MMGSEADGALQRMRSSSGQALGETGLPGGSFPMLSGLEAAVPGPGQHAGNGGDGLYQVRSDISKDGVFVRVEMV